MSASQLLQRIDEVELSLIQMGDDVALRRVIAELRAIAEYFHLIEQVQVPINFGECGLLERD